MKVSNEATLARKSRARASAKQEAWADGGRARTCARVHLERQQARSNILAAAGNSRPQQLAVTGKPSTGCRAAICCGCQGQHDADDDAGLRAGQR